LKARVIEPKHEFYDCIFEVAYLSYENIAGRDSKSGDIIAARFDEVEFKCDANWEESIIRNRDILNIKKPKKASFYMYYAIIKSIEEHIGLSIDELLILDDNELDSKKVWIKKIIAAANSNPIAINITGQNYSNKFDIKLTDMNKEEFIKECQSEIVKLQIGLKGYEKRINGLMNTVQSINGEKMYTSTQGLSLKGA
jgi:hypothetical protein